MSAHIKKWSDRMAESQSLTFKEAAMREIADLRAALSAQAAAPVDERAAIAWVTPLRYGSQVTFFKPPKPQGWDDDEDEWYCKPLSYIAPEQFYMDHGQLHDRVTGQHLWTQDQYDECRRDSYIQGKEDAALAHPVVVDVPICNCDLRTKLVGDGCDVCNPEYAARITKENIIDAAIVAYEEKFKRDSNDPSCSKELNLWCDAWRTAIAAQDKEGGT